MKLTTFLKVFVSLISQKRLPSPTSTAPVYDPEAKSSIFLKMSPMIKAKAYSTQASNPTNFGEFSLVICNVL